MSIAKLAGTKGMIHISSADGAKSGLNFHSIVVQEDSVLTAFKIGGADALASCGLTGKTLKAGAFITAPEGTIISDITLSSGSVIGYKAN